MRKIVVGIALLAGLVIAVSIAYPHLQTAATPAAAQAPAAPPPAIPVTEGTVAAADVPVFISGIGTVQGYNMVIIKSRVDGQITRVLFTEGQEVKAGDPLFQIDPRPFQATLEQAQAAKAKDQAQLAMAQLDLERYGQLVGQGHQTRQSYEQQGAMVAQLEAAIKGDEALIDTAKLNLGYADIRAPIDGRLSARLIDIGNMVHASDTNGLVTIAQLRPIFVSFTLAQTNLDAIRQAQVKGQLVVRAYANDNKSLLSEGKLTLIDNAIDQATGTIHLKATFANADERLWPGEFVNLRLVLDTRRGVPTVPAQTVQEGPNGKYVYVIKDDNTVERRPVEVADVQDGIAVVTKGLSAGDRVVVEGQYRLTSGARINPTAPARGAAG
jgi:multidrug efflux system membrane fusion protein